MKKMIERVKGLLTRFYIRRLVKLGYEFLIPTNESVKEVVRDSSIEAFNAGYEAGLSDGKKEGLSIARTQATNALKAILAEQNSSNS